jgi:anti-anti-sigma factor
MVVVTRQVLSSSSVRHRWSDAGRVGVKEAAGMAVTTEVPNGGIGLVRRNGASVVELWGAIDATLRTEAGRALAGVLDLGGPVEIDASRISFIDSAGVAFLVQLCTVGRDEGLQVSVVNPPRPVVAAMRLLGYDEGLNLLPRSAA